MRQHTLKETALDVGSWEKEIQRRLQRGKARLLLIDASCLLLAMIIIFFVI